MQLVDALQSEWIKRRKTAINWLVICGGLFIPFIRFSERLINPSKYFMSNMADGSWMKLFDQCWHDMSIFIMPMGIILAASLIAQIEFRNNTWKQLYATPQSFSNIFWAKYIVVLIISLQFFAVFICGIYLAGIIPPLISSNLDLPKDSFPLWNIVLGSTKFLVYSLPILSLQYLLSLHFRNFIISISIGFGLLMASLIGMGWKFGYIIPYSYGALQYLATDNKTDPNANIFAWSVLYFLLFTVINYLLFLGKSQSKFSKFVSTTRKSKTKLVAFILGFVIVVSLSVFGFSNLAGKAENTVFSANEIEQKITEFENNLGTFILHGADGWNISDRMKHYKVNGLSIAIIHDYKIVYAKGYGLADTSTKNRVDVNTMFIPGSLSKSINALGILHLVEQGKLNLFTDINTQLKSWQFPYNNLISKGKRICLANLLSHNAGLSVHGFYGYKPNDTFPTISQILDGKYPANSEPVRSVSAPGDKMEYSGGGTMISQLMLMDAVNQNYDSYMQKTLFEPLGMINSSFTNPPPSNKLNNLATGYDTLGKQINGKFPVLIEQAAGGLWTTPTDIAKFVIEMQLSLQGKSNKILSKKMTEVMLTPYSDEKTALGVFVTNENGYKYFGHDAANLGFSGTYFGSFEGGNGVVIFINSENAPILKEIANSVASAFNWKGLPIKKHKQVIENVPDNFKKVTGKYIATISKTENVLVEIKLENNHYYYITDHGKWRIYITSDNEFVCLESPTEKTLILDSTGALKGFSSTYLDKTLTFEKQNTD